MSYFLKVRERTAPAWMLVFSLFLNFMWFITPTKSCTLAQEQARSADTKNANAALIRDLSETCVKGETK